MILREHLPTVHELTALLAGLGVRDPECTLTSTVPPAPWCAAVYDVRGTDEPAVAVLLDLALAASLAAAIVGIPKGVVDEAVADGTLSPVLAENLHEVLNILGSLLTSPVTTGVSLAEVSLPGDHLPAAVPALLESGQDQSYHITLRGYPGGRLRLAGRA